MWAIGYTMPKTMTIVFKLINRKLDSRKISTQSSKISSIKNPMKNDINYIFMDRSSSYIPSSLKALRRLYSLAHVTE